MKFQGKLNVMKSSFGNIPEALRLVWRADTMSSLGMGGLTLVSAALPISQAWVAKLIVDSVVSSRGQISSARDALIHVGPYLALEFVLFVMGTTLSQLRNLLEEILDHRLGHEINTRIIKKALTLDLHYFEDAEFYDKLQNARRQSEYRALAIVNSSFLLIQNLITLVSFSVVLFSFNAWIALVLFSATIPSFLVQSRYSKLNFRLQSWKAPETRKMQYLEHVLTVDSTVKEVKLFGLGESLLSRYNDLFWRTFKEDKFLATSRSLLSLLWGLLATFSYYGCYAFIVVLTLQAKLTLGEMTLYLSLFRQSQGTFQGVFDNIAKLFENGLFMENLFTFLGLAPQAEGKTVSLPPGLGLIEFRNVSFKYPNQSNWVLRDFSLTIQPGEKLALVGENGAGKTTLIKLMSRLYDPSEGAVFLDGINLKDYPLAELRHRIGVIFQDFVKYQLTIRENIGFGAVEKINDLEKIKSAAEKGGAESIIEGLEDGFETTLGGWFLDGRELSGGQWQKIALSRAFMREGTVLVLDEPTSALDAKHEYEIFKRFRELTQGKTALLISHRFSTVRMADRIAVIADGKLSEIGSHQELVQAGGPYAKLFALQAEGYR